MKELKVSQLETQYEQSNNNQTLQEMINLKYEYNTILTKQVSDQLSRLQTCYFELGRQATHAASPSTEGAAK